MDTTDTNEEPPITPPKYIVTSLIFSQNHGEEDSLFEIRRHGKCFYISLDPQNLLSSPSLKTHYLDFLSKERSDSLGSSNSILSGGEEYHPEDFYEWVLDPCIPLFDRLAPSPSPEKKKETRYTLDEYLHPEIFYYALHAVDGILQPIQTDGRGGGMLPPGFELEDSVFSPLWPTFLPSEIQIIDTTDPEEAISGIPSKVLIPGNTIVFFKGYQCGDEKLALRELQNYRSITDSNLGEEVRISRIKGIVKNEKNQLLGLLLTYIDCEYVTLTCAVEVDTTVVMRRKWVDQVTGILGEMHGAGVVWGDAKTDNVLVDKEGDAWIVDFEGGYTRGFVEREKAGTKEGDLQGLGKIVEFVFREIEG